MTARPLVGCAGWAYRDWVGPVYPSRLTPSDWLAAYADLFNFVEAEATFHETPTESTVRGWLDRVRGRDEFRFAVPAPAAATHEALPAGHPSDVDREIANFLERAVEPLEDARRLAAVLVRLPPNLAYYGAAGDDDALHALTHLLEALEPKRRRVAVEFAHGSWFDHVGETLAPEVQEALASLGATTVRVDAVGSRFHRSRTASWSYFRLHGRRDPIPPSERGFSHAPHNYQYPRDDLVALAESIRRSGGDDEATLVAFQNHYRGQSVRNALDLVAALGGTLPAAASNLTRASKLDEFSGA